MSFLADWKSAQTAIPKNEIAFFRFLAYLLKKHYTNIHYYEVHGNPGHVSFNSGLWPAKPPVTKEIGDLIIITFSYKTMEARYTIHQNKFHKTTGAQRVQPTFKFRADIHQYDLLAYRPIVKSVSSIVFPPSILAGTDYDSVGSYGVFYEDNGHLIDYIYSIAKWLSPQSYVDSCNLILNTFQNEMSVNDRETICTVGIEAFVKHLLGMRIGAPITSPEIGSFLMALIRKAADEADEDPPIIDLSVFNQRMNEAIDIGSGGYRLLVINTDAAT